MINDLEWYDEPVPMMGSASTINTSISHDGPQRPMGFIWPPAAEPVAEDEAGTGA